MEPEKYKIILQVGEYVRKYRKASGLTLRALEQKTGVAYAYLSRLENAKTTFIPRKGTLNKIADALNMDKEELYVEAGYKKRPFAVLGTVSAGIPIEAIEIEETMLLTDFFDPTKHYVINVQGDSMIDAGIYDGDRLFFEAKSKVDQGQIVVARIDRFEVTVKVLGRCTKKLVRLLPQNKKHKVMEFAAQRVEILGIVVGEMRTDMDKLRFPTK